MKPVITLAFYKGDGNIFDWGVRKVTSSLYSHSELIVNGLSYSSRIEDSGVKYKYRMYSPDAWDFIEIDTSKIDLELLQKVHNDAIGFGYDEFIAPLIKAVQGLSAQVEGLKAQLNSQ